MGIVLFSRAEGEGEGEENDAGGASVDDDVSRS
jgi:hypothetical protein